MNSITKYFQDTARELKQVTWPTQKQALFYTALVLVISTVVALFVGAFDYLFSQVINIVITNF